MGKGDKRRPTVVDDATHQARWDKAFGKPSCKVCGRDHRTTPVCCWECGDSNGERHSVACDWTWRERA
jgi:predicted amidophosphoribosyltransferase